MNPINLRNITNHFQDVRLVSLSTWRQANEIIPRDRGGPYVVLQEGYDPDDLKLIPTEFIIGRSGKWIPLATFFHLPVNVRRAEFVFGTAGEVMEMMDRLPTRAEILPRVVEAEEMEEDDGISAAIEKGKSHAVHH